MLVNVGLRPTQLALVATAAFFIVLMVVISRSSTYPGSSYVAQFEPDNGMDPLASATTGLRPAFKARNLPTTPSHLVTAESLLKLITSKMTTNQQTLQNYIDVTNVIRQLAPANVLVFGLGTDTQFYYTANPGGVCVYVEESPQWISMVAAPSFVTVLQYNYHTTVADYPRYANMTNEQLHDLLYMKDLPRYMSTVVDPSKSAKQRIHTADGLDSALRGDAYL